MQLKSVSVFAIALAMLLSVTAPASAIITARDSFEDYTAGDQLHTLDGGYGFSGAWDVADAARRPEVTIVSGGLSYSAGDISIDGGANALQYAATEGGITVLTSRELPATSDTVYFSLLYQQSVQVGDVDFSQIGLESSAGGNPRVTALDRNDNYQLRSTTSAANSVDTGIASTTGQTSLLVVKASKTGGSSTYNDLTMWVDPTSTFEGLNTASATSSVNSGLNLSSAAFLSVRKAFQESGDTFLIDNVVVGDSFADVVANPDFFTPVMISTGDGNGADARLQSGASADTNFGATTTLDIKNTTDPAFQRKGIFRFDISGLTPQQISEAVLELTVDGFLGNSSSDEWIFDIYGLNDGHPGEGWDENAVTWNNAPGNDTASGNGVLAGDVFGGDALGSFSVLGQGVTGTKVGINSNDFADLLAFLQSDTDGQVSFLLTRRQSEQQGDSNVVHRFYTHENSAETGPKLMLTLYSPVPEPASASLMLLSGLALLRRRRAA